MNFDITKESPRKEFFSGANTRVYFGDVWVDQLETLEFEVNETVMPIYGFHSYVFDKIARGQRIVNGSFTINFTEIGYLQTILDRLSSRVDRGNDNLLWTDAHERLEADTGKYSSEHNINTLLSLSKTNYDDYINNLKHTYWGRKPFVEENTVNRSGQQREVDTHFYPNANKEFGDNPLKNHGFNMVIDFSPSSNVRDFEQSIQDNDNQYSLYRTSRTIMGVHITGERQEMTPDGRVLKITYTFIARDVDGNAQELSMKHNALYDRSRSTFDRVWSTTERNRAIDGYYQEQQNITNVNRGTTSTNRGITHLR